MTHRSYSKRGKTAPAMALVVASWMVLQRSGPIVEGAEINAIAAFAAAILVICSFTLLSDLFWFAGDVLDWIKARKPTGLKGTAGWIKHLKELKGDLIKHGWGPYWGTFKGKEIIADFASNALTLGPAGTGKGVGEIQPTILSIRESKTIIDFKGELSCVLARTLRERGENVKILNLGEMWTDILGESDQYNPLVVITDDFWRSGGLLDVSDDIHEICLQLHPNPENGNGDNKHFYDGCRDFIGFAIQTCILIDGYDATLGDVAQMLNDRSSLLQHAQWAAGRLEQVGASA